MRLTNSATQYGSVARFFHWTIVLLIINQFVVAALMLWGANATSAAGIARKDLFGWHKECGFLILILVVLRFVWRQATKLPDWPQGMTKWEESAVRFIERGLYAVLFIMPATGLLLSLSGGHGFEFFGLLKVPGLHKPNELLSNIGWFLHRATSYAIIAFVSLHIAYVFRRHIFEKDRFLYRMLPFAKA